MICSSVTLDPFPIRSSGWAGLWDQVGALSGDTAGTVL